ncbi:MAG: Asp-tRNA(Asn)/Glu-tRNA(Gln) amidotransferase subunit GatB [Spirochaetes bacterium]|nr:Asp-tRNA(Asn)/Glu-tRNA(Gln) amidotransferase subunit GatB [Spirochaetota bacterium]
MNWDTVIGLEVHVQLNTKTKLFSHAETSFGAGANSHTTALDQGHPGTLPVLNREALRKAIQAGLALHCTINEYSRFDRKNYFYPDLPKAYQISQYHHPICSKGWLEISVNDPKRGEYARKIHLTRIHLEEDAGKLVHGQGGAVAESYVDLNRAGTPLIEIVSEPELTSALEAVAYLQKLRSILLYLGVSDCNMEEGSLRCDANISLKPEGSSALGNRTEIKNMNTFKGLLAAVEYEVRRQQRVLEGGGKVETETLLFDPVERKTRSMRSKEDAHDYRYFPEPDLPPVLVGKDQVDAIAAALPELPDAKRDRYQKDFGLSLYDADVLVSEKPMASYFEAAVAAFPAEPKKICNWITTEIAGTLNEGNRSIETFPVKPEALGELVRLVSEGAITGKIAKELFAEMIATGKRPADLVKEKGIQVISDDGALRAICERLIRENPDPVAKYRGGNKNALGFFVGAVMKETKGQANPKSVNQILAELLK